MQSVPAGCEAAAGRKTDGVAPSARVSARAGLPKTAAGLDRPLAKG
jgi:hypothetical protein